MKQVELTFSYNGKNFRIAKEGRISHVRSFSLDTYSEFFKELGAAKTEKDKKRLIGKYFSSYHNHNGKGAVVYITADGAVRSFKEVQNIRVKETGLDISLDDEMESLFEKLPEENNDNDDSSEMPIPLEDSSIKKVS